jgi:hypothetical protein
MGWCGLDWSGLGRGQWRAFWNTVMNRVPYNAGKFLINCTTGDF